jgi:hypothetical protein
MNMKSFFMHAQTWGFILLGVTNGFSANIHNLGPQRTREELIYDLTDLLVSPSSDIRVALVGKESVGLAARNESVIYIENATWAEKRVVNLVKCADFTRELSIGGANPSPGLKIIKRDRVITVLRGRTLSEKELDDINIAPGDLVIKLENSYPGFGGTIEDSEDVLR